MARSDVANIGAAGELTPAMRELPNERWRAFVRAWCDQPTGQQNAAQCARKAGFQCESAESFASVGYRLLNDPRIVEAIQELARKQLRSLAPKAVAALDGLLDKPGAKDHARAIGMVLDRTDPAIAKQDITVKHEKVDPTKDALDLLRAQLELGTPREGLIKLFGPNGLTRLERLLREKRTKEAEKASLIEGKAEVVIDGTDLFVAAKSEEPKP